ncbi:MAG: N-acetyl-gamma-glutamyl-phosphate reductase [Alicyclobacillus sp.]|nr:N-acetyl-gamma-glutamyl-phosphate reductase [Alicyclobacillus sp.]
MGSQETRRVRVGVIGASGYGGAELVRLLHHHPGVEWAYLGAHSQTAPDVAQVYPHLRGLGLALEPYQADAVAERCEAVFVALPSGVSGNVAAELAGRGLRVIDLSGDLRLPADIYRQWYAHDPVHPAVQAQAVYGLTEWNRQALPSAQLVANPGCYATAVLLALLPLAAAGWLPERGVVVDAQSGVSGAGRTPTQSAHLGELYENFYPYKVGRHQHTPEIEQTLSAYAPVRLLLTTQLLPAVRGIYAVFYVPLPPSVSLSEVRARFDAHYAQEPFVDLYGPGEVPQLKHVRGSNKVALGLALDERTGVLQVFSALDNLVKGAAGQAVQNFNVMYGWP